MWPISPATPRAAVVHVVADDDAAADAGADEDADHGARALADAVGVLADDGDAHVVVEEDAHAASADDSRSASGTFSQPRLGAVSTMPRASSTPPGTPTQTRAQVAGAARRAAGLMRRHRSIMRSMTASAPVVGDASCALGVETWPCASTAAACILVPPRSNADDERIVPHGRR